VNRCDSDQHATCQCRRWHVPARASFQHVVEAQVMIDAPFETRKVRCDEVALGRMQVPAGGIAAQRPGGVAQRLPCRDRERQLEENGDRVARERRGQRQLACPQSIETRGQVLCGKRELEARRAAVAPKRIRLVRPVEVSGPGRIAAQLVLAALVVVENGTGWIHDGDSLSTTQPPAYEYRGAGGEASLQYGGHPTPSPRTMIVLFTDFGSDDIYVAQVKAVLAQQTASGTPIHDLLHR